jgi:hypothetical protein
MLRSFARLAAVVLTLAVAAVPPRVAASDELTDKPAPGTATQPSDAGSRSQASSRPVAREELEDALEQAKKDNEGVAIWLKQVREGRAGIRELIQQYQIGDAKTERFVLAKIRGQVAALDKAAAALLRRGPGFEKDLELYAASLKKAEATYRHLAGLYQRKAVGASNPRYQKLYRQLSGSAGAAAQVMGENRKGIDRTRAHARRLLSEVAESREVLKDLSGYLDVGMEADKLAASIVAFYEDIRAYNHELDQTVRNINEWLQKQEATSGDPPAPGSRPAP